MKQMSYKKACRRSAKLAARRRRLAREKHNRKYDPANIRWFRMAR